MTKPGFIHPKMNDWLGIYNATCTILENQGEKDEYGQVEDDYQPVTGLVDIEAAIGPTGGDEISSQDAPHNVAGFTIELKGVYKEITGNMRAEINGKQYDILLSETDSRRNRTRLQVEVRE